MDTAGLKTIWAMRAEDSLSKQCVVKGNNSQVPYCEYRTFNAGQDLSKLHNHFRHDDGSQKVA